LGVVAIPTVGFAEYASLTNAWHCRVLGYTDSKAPDDCAAEDLAEGVRRSQSRETVFSPREHLAIHTFNHGMALGGLLVGWPEVASETARMSWSSEPRVVHQDDFPMHSVVVQRNVRQAFQKAKRQGPLKDGERRPLDLGAVHWTQVRTESTHRELRTALALEVDDSRLSGEWVRTGTTEQLLLRWRGTITYPQGDVSLVSWPWPTGRVRLSETIFYGMQLDGEMQPFELEYQWEVDAEDPHLPSANSGRL